MAEYFVRFTAYIDERKRPENFPHQVHDTITLRVDSAKQLGDIVNARCAAYHQSQGMAVSIEPEDAEKMGLGEINRIFVPSHMWTHMTLSMVKPIIGENPQISETGEITLPSGKEVVKQ
jgi:hypothetical protein